MSINIDGISLINISDDTNIYRFLTFPQLMGILGLGKMSLRKVIEWEDTWEVPVKLLLPEDEIENKKKECKQYGNCWSLSYESDAMWRIYSPDCKDVCISSTAGKLKDTITSLNPGINGCIAPIIYDDIAGPILDELFGRRYTNTYGPYLFSCLKRKPFSHEQEVRLLINKIDLSIPTPKFIDIHVNYHDFINEVFFDPRVQSWYYETMKKYLDSYGITCSKYDLYTPKKMDVNISVDFQVIKRNDEFPKYVTYKYNQGIFHLVNPSTNDQENDNTLCGQDLCTRNGHSIWKHLSTDLTFYETQPDGKRLCKNCQRHIQTKMN